MNSSPEDNKAGKVLRQLEKFTKGYSYRSHKYSLENNELPTFSYDSKHEIIFKKDNKGETDPDVNGVRNLSEIAKRYKKFNKPLFKYFLDGSRKIYKVDDFAYSGRVYPVIAGQVGVGCCVRESSRDFKSFELSSYLALSLPECANKDGIPPETFFASLKNKVNNSPILQKRKLRFEKILPYEDRELEEGEEYKHKATAKIQDEMINSEKLLVRKLAQENRLDDHSYLLKDGSLQYQSTEGDTDLKSLALLKSNYRCVVGVSKSFNPELFKDKHDQDISRRIADLELHSRTPAYKYSSKITGDVQFSVWYLRIRDKSKTISPFDGIIKVEKILVTEEEIKKGLHSDEVDSISANLINESYPTAYGLDKRWANHLYPVYLTEKFVKSQYLSDMYFLNIF